MSAKSDDKPEPRPARILLDYSGMVRSLLLVLATATSTACVFDRGGLSLSDGQQGDLQGGGVVGWPGGEDGSALPIPTLGPDSGSAAGSDATGIDRRDGGTSGTPPRADGGSSRDTGGSCTCGALERCYAGTCHKRCWAGACRVSGCRSGQYCHELDKVGNGVCLPGAALDAVCSSSKPCAQDMICVSPCDGGDPRCRRLCSFGCKPGKEQCGSLTSSSCKVCVPKGLLDQC